MTLNIETTISINVGNSSNHHVQNYHSSRMKNIMKYFEIMNVVNVIFYITNVDLIIS